eukprot:jgi/Chlat1/7017/Chrsp56S06660
MSMRPQRKRLC